MIPISSWVAQASRELTNSTAGLGATICYVYHDKFGRLDPVTNWLFTEEGVGRPGAR